MSWTNLQKARAMRACKKAGIDDDTRKFILRQFHRSKFDRNGRPTDEPSFTSKKLTNADFDAFMDHIERRPSGGRDPDHRARWKVTRMANTLELTPAPGEDRDGKRLLEPEGVGLRGWIVKLFGEGMTLERLRGHELYQLIESLKAYGTRNGVKWTGDRTRKQLSHG